MGKIAEKIRQQWKTVRKAFCDLNMGKSGYIKRDELEFQLQHWGYRLDK